MIMKWYEITCDYCGTAVNHLPYRPSNDELEKDGIIIRRGKHFCCNQCYILWRNGGKES